MAKIIQQQDRQGNDLYPVIHAESIPADAVTTGKVADKAITEPKLADEVTKKIGDSKTVTDTLLRAFAEAKGDPYYLTDTFVRAGLIPIPFEDAEVKRILVEKYDTDGDGELWYSDIKDVEVFPMLFDANDKITKFNEFRFFDACTTMESKTSDQDPRRDIVHSCFAYCYNLESIEFPKNLADIPNSAFALDGKLTIVGKKLPDSVKHCGYYAFFGCSSFDVEGLPEGIRELKVGVFGECESLSLSRLPESIERIEGSAFYRCTHLRLDQLPSGLQWLSEIVFTECINITVSELPDTMIPTGLNHAATFRGCDGITAMSLPASLNEIGVSVFYGCKNLTELTMRGSTPPILNVVSFGGETKLTAIYVPDDAVEAYKAATNWAAYADIIKPVSEKPTT